jgi:hypothetical protein
MEVVLTKKQRDWRYGYICKILEFRRLKQQLSKAEKNKNFSETRIVARKEKTISAALEKLEITGKFLGFQEKETNDIINIVTAMTSDFNGELPSAEEVVKKCS